MDTLKILLKDSRFWAALWLVVQTILFYFLPTFPPEIWSAVNGLFAVVLAVLAVPVAMSTARSVRATRDANTRG